MEFKISYSQVASTLSPVNQPNVRVKSCGRPNYSRARHRLRVKGTTVCVLFCKRRTRLGPAINTRCAGRRQTAMPAACSLFWRAAVAPVAGLASQGDAAARHSAWSSNSSGSRPFKPRDAGATPVRAAIFLKEAPVLNPRPENALPYRILSEPAGGPSPAGANFRCAWCKSSTLPRAHTHQGAVVFNSEHSGLLIRTVRVRIPPAPPF
jgi:hypothetical protein